MRHRKNIKRLSRQSAHRKAVLRNQVKSLLTEERIKTTVTLAKESRKLFAKLITFGKKNTLAARRNAFEILNNRSLVKLLFSEVAPRFSSRAGGYTRIVHLGNRKGDNASLVILEMTELKKEEVKEKKTKKEKKAKKPSKSPEKKEVKNKKETQTKEAKVQKEEKDSKKKDKKGFIGGLRKFLKQDNVE